MKGLRPSVLRLAAEHRMLLGALTGALALHGTLLVAGTFRTTYDAYVHMFFADHYAREWFSTWEPRWYTGFTVTSYPPGTHQLIALWSRLVGLEIGFGLVQLGGILLVVVGVYRLTTMLAGRRAAGPAALLAVVSTSIGEAVHVFGQLPTICSLGLLLNALPFVRRWVVGGDRRHLVAAAMLLAGTTALHHVTTMFGAVFFLGPVIVDGLVERLRVPHPEENDHRPALVRPSTVVPLVARRLRRIVAPTARSGLLAGVVVLVLVIVVLPYWVWSGTDPISQVPIPHASRESFLADPNAGLVFWLIPWGAMLAVLPYAAVRGIRSHTWPYVASLALLTLLGTGGTTPLPRLLLGGAFEILTLDRFTFWATILILPYAGMLADELGNGGLALRLRRIFGDAGLHLVQATALLGLIAAMAFTVNLAQFRRMQPDPIDPAPIVAFLEKDDHSRWRYLTLGFGDQMAWLSAQTTAQTVDGNYHSARRLPELISTPVERLEGAKFRGIPGLGSLQQFLGSPERYHLKYVFANDQYYDPLLQFSGWRILQRLENGIVVWEREDVPPLPAVLDRPPTSPVFAAMWGVLPLTALLSAGAGATCGWWRPRPARTGRGALARLERALGALARVPDGAPDTGPSWKEPFQRFARRMRISDRALRRIGLVAAIGLVAGLGGATLFGPAPGPDDVIEGFYQDLDHRRLESAWARLDPRTRPTLEEYLLTLSIEDGLYDSYSLLDTVQVVRVEHHPGGAVALIDLTYVSSLTEHRAIETVELVNHSGRWWLQLPPPKPGEPPQRLARRAEVLFEAPGRRTVTTTNTEYDDVLDRPEIAIRPGRIVLLDGRPAMIGEVHNVDVDPASLTVTAQLVDAAGDVLLRANARQVIEHSLLPNESTPYRVDFEGIAGMETGDFDPTEFTAVAMPPAAVAARVDTSAVVTTRGLARPLSLQNVTTSVDATGAMTLSGEIFNHGTDAATVTALLVSMFDRDGSLLWVDWLVVPAAAQPGRSAEFAGRLVARSRLQPIGLPVRDFANGMPATTADTRGGFIPTPEASGFSGISLTPVVFVRPAS